MEESKSNVANGRRPPYESYFAAKASGNPGSFGKLLSLRRRVLVTCHACCNSLAFSLWSVVFHDVFFLSPASVS